VKAKLLSQSESIDSAGRAPRVIGGTTTDLGEVESRHGRVNRPDVQERKPSAGAEKETAGGGKSSVPSQSGSVGKGGPEQPQKLRGGGNYYAGSIDYNSGDFKVANLDGFEEIEQIRDGWEILHADDIVADKISSLSTEMTDHADRAEEYTFTVNNEKQLVLISPHFKFLEIHAGVAPNLYEGFLTTTPLGSSSLWMEPNFKRDYTSFAVSLYQHMGDDHSTSAKVPKDKKVCEEMQRKLLETDIFDAESPVQQDIELFIKIPATKMAVIHLNDALNESKGKITPKVQTLLSAMQSLTGQTGQQVTFNKYFGHLLTRAASTRTEPPPVQVTPKKFRFEENYKELFQDMERTPSSEDLIFWNETGEKIEAVSSRSTLESEEEDFRRVLENEMINIVSKKSEHATEINRLNELLSISAESVVRAQKDERHIGLLKAELNVLEGKDLPVITEIQGGRVVWTKEFETTREKWVKDRFANFQALEKLGNQSILIPRLLGARPSP